MFCVKPASQQKDCLQILAEDLQTILLTYATIYVFPLFS